MSRSLLASIALGIVLAGSDGCGDPARVSVRPPFPLPERHLSVPPPPTPPPPPPPPTAESRARDQALFEATFKPFLPRIGTAESATLFLITPQRSRSARGFHGYPIRARTTLTQAGAHDLAQLLDAPSTYAPSSSGCYVPGAAVTLLGDIGRLDVVLCLDCQYIDPEPANDSERIRPLSDHGTEQLRALFARAFPKAFQRPRHRS